MKLLKPVIATVIGLAIAAALLWNAGEKHIENCQNVRKVACTVLPWSGHYTEIHLTPAGQRSRDRARREQDTLLKEACLSYGTC